MTPRFFGLHADTILSNLWRADQSKTAEKGRSRADCAQRERSRRIPEVVHADHSTKAINNRILAACVPFDMRFLASLLLMPLSGFGTCAPTQSHPKPQRLCETMADSTRFFRREPAPRQSQAGLVALLWEP